MVFRVMVCFKMLGDLLFLGLALAIDRVKCYSTTLGLAAFSCIRARL